MMATVGSPCVRDKGVFMKGQVKLSAYMNYGLFTVHIVQGRHLTSAWNPQPNTFVMISLIPDAADTTPTRCRTAVIHETGRPAYNEKFSFELSDDDFNKRLLVTVWHRDPNSGLHESLGCTSFGLHNLQTGEKEVNGWYHLLTDDVGRKKHLHVARKERRPPLPSTSRPQNIPAINQNVASLDRLDLTVHRAQYGGFGFTLVDSCPVIVGRVDRASRAEESGLQKGDIVIRVNGQNVSRSTSVSVVAKCIKRSGSMVHLEIQRPRQLIAPPTQHTDSTHHKGNNSDSEDSGCQSVQEFTICDDRAALLQSAISVDTRRQAALHRLLCIEENFVDAMNCGIYKFSRPLRHCILTSSQHASLFQNIEKIVCMSQYQVQQIVDNLPSYTPSDGEDDTDTSFKTDSDLTSSVAMIYLSKLPILCQAFTLYSAGLPRASNVLSQLENNVQFHDFLKKTPSQGTELRLCDFINRPLHHVQELCGITHAILETTYPGSRDHVMYSGIVTGLQSCVDQIVYTQCVTSSLPSTSRRVVPMMGSLVRKRSSSVKSTGDCSSSSGFGSGSSHHSDTETPCVSDTDIW